MDIFVQELCDLVDLWYL